MGEDGSCRFPGLAEKRRLKTSSRSPSSNPPIPANRPATRAVDPIGPLRDSKNRSRRRAPIQQARTGVSYQAFCWPSVTGGAMAGQNRRWPAGPSGHLLGRRFKSVVQQRVQVLSPPASSARIAMRSSASRRRIVEHVGLGNAENVVDVFGDGSEVGDKADHRSAASNDTERVEGVVTGTRVERTESFVDEHGLESTAAPRSDLNERQRRRVQRPGTVRHLTGHRLRGFHRTPC